MALQLQSQLSELDIKVSIEEIEKRLNSLINEFKVPENEAKRTVKNYFLNKSSVSQFGNLDSEFIKIGNIKTEGKWVNTRAKVVQLWDNEHESISQVGLIGDETGIMKFVSWTRSSLPQVEENKSYEFKNLVTDFWNGRYSLKMNQNSEIKELGEDIKVGSSDVEMTGAIIAIQEGSGLIERCPICNRALIDESCGEHGGVEGKSDLRVKAILDDGQEAHDILLNAEITEKVCKITIKKAKKASAFEGTILEEIRSVLLGRYFKVKGPKIGRYILANEVSEYNLKEELDQILKGFKEKDDGVDVMEAS